MTKHEDYLKLCYSLAKKGIGKVSPNPLVGSVIVKNGKVLAEGFHKQHGEIHAEIDALNKLVDVDLSNAILYVNLEPCSHHSKGKINSPCAPEIIKSGIRKVVISTQDPNPSVNGLGIKMLKDNDIEVLFMPMEESLYLNRFFIVNQIKKKPFVTLKIAQSLDGRISRAPGKNQMITDEDARKVVHHLRNEHDAILVGSNTVMKDNPELTIRTFNAENPTRVIIDSELKTDSKSNVYTDKQAKTILFTSNINNKAYQSEYTEIVVLKKKDGFLYFKEIFNDLFKKGIQSILIEAGPKLSSALIEQNLVDEVILFIAPKIIGFGNSSFEDLSFEKKEDVISFESVKTELINDQLIFKGMLTKCLQDL